MKEVVYMGVSKYKYLIRVNIVRKEGNHVKILLRGEKNSGLKPFF